MSTAKDLKRLRWADHGAKIFSTCGKRQYMALIFDAEGHLIGEGYNGSPPGMPHCVDGFCPRFVNDAPADRLGDYDNCVSTHAELNALIHSPRKPGSELVVNGSPCWGCAKAIASAQIHRLVCAVDESDHGWDRIKELLTDANVLISEYDLTA